MMSVVINSSKAEVLLIITQLGPNNGDSQISCSSLIGLLVLSSVELRFVEVALISFINVSASLLPICYGSGSSCLTRRITLSDSDVLATLSLCLA